MVNTVQQLSRGKGGELVQVEKNWDTYKKIKTFEKFIVAKFLNWIVWVILVEGLKRLDGQVVRDLKR